jgi:hypothetical protein
MRREPRIANTIEVVTRETQLATKNRDVPGSVSREPAADYEQPSGERQTLVALPLRGHFAFRMSKRSPNIVTASTECKKPKYADKHACFKYSYRFS